MLNHITIHGRLTKDPELRQTQSGVPVCNFTVAVDRSFNKGEDKQSDFFDCVAWRGLAELLSKYFSKGKEIVVYGEMQSRKWSDKEGNNRLSWEVMATGVDFCGSKGSGSVVAEVSVVEDIPNVVSMPTTPANDDDLPF